jgi:hypothetical protein
LEKTRLVMNASWKCKVAPSDFVLGIQRDIFVEEGAKKERMSQAAFFESAFQEFDLCTRPHVTSGRLPKTALPPGVAINISMAAKDEEEKKAVVDAGYQKLAECTLWGARGCCVLPTIAVGRITSVQCNVLPFIMESLGLSKKARANVGTRVGAVARGTRALRRASRRAAVGQTPRRALRYRGAHVLALWEREETEGAPSGRQERCFSTVLC